MDREFLLEQIEFLKQAITAYNTAILAVQTGGVQSYSINTGQTQQSVTKQNLSTIIGTYNSMLNTLQTLEALLYGGSFYARPVF
jgi:hypothetical protein